MTVTGPISPDALGTTLMHEHLFLQSASKKYVAPDESTPATEAARWHVVL